jgi:Ni/Fe-hydrogenase 1 B-type cytochrome subunit
MALLAFTGYYIGNPFIIVSSDTAQAYMMGWIRAIHFVSAFFLLVGFVLRVYWFFVGNRYASWRDWIPTTRERVTFLWKQFKYYIFLERKRPQYLGHNPVAGLSYVGLLLMMAIQGISGFALYAEPYTSGFWRAVFGWLLTLFGNQTLRLIHHALMWVFGIFFIIHFYMAVLEEIEEREFSLSGIVSGVKLLPEQDE